MCGIAGTFSPGPNQSIDAMLDALAHRGKDDRQQWRGAGVALGVQRLAIVDRAQGRQPFVDNGVVAVCNGEIYNHVNLRKTLEEKGHRFKTACDVEVILHAYKEWGSGLTKHLEGQFAFAIWDNRKQRLMLARDRYGIIPLFYTRMGGGFSFASEIKALLQITGVQRTVNRRAIDDYLAMRYAPGPETFFEGIFQLEPGYMLLIDREGSGVSRTWAEPVFVEEYQCPFASIAEASEALEEALRQGVAKRLQGEVPVGLYLSGGLDSAVVGKFAYEAGKNVSKQIQSYSHGFDGKTDEILSARKVAKALGIELEEVPLDDSLMLELPRIVRAVESPVANSDILGLWALARHASRSVRVVLCGEGADEIFGSYPHQQLILDLAQRSEGWREWAAKILNWIPPNWLRNTGPYSGALSDPTMRERLLRVLENEETGDRYRELTSLFSKEDRERMYTREMKEEIAANPGKREEIISQLRYLRSPDDVLQTFSEIKMKYFLPDYHLGRENRIAMAFGMEARYPYLDEQVVQQMVQLDASFKMGGKPRDKRPLRDVAKRHLPGWIAKKPKGPVRVPMPLFSKSFNELKHEYLRPKRIRKRGIIRPDAIESLLRREDLSPFIVQRQLFAIVMLEVWFEQFKIGS